MRKMAGIRATGLALMLVAAIATPAIGGSAQPGEAGSARDSGLSTLGTAGWRVVSSAVANGGGQRISVPGFDTSAWLRVSPDDAGAPGTEITALLQNGKCPNVFYSDNMRRCFGYENAVGPDTVPRFSVPWWFRTDFTPAVVPGQDAKLIVNGVVGDLNR